MNITGFVASIPGFDRRNHPDKMRAFAWFLQTHLQRDRFAAADVRRCYDEAHIEKPANTNRFLDALAEKRPPDLLKDAGGYRLAQGARERLDRELGKSGSVIVVERMLSDLPGKITDESERLFLSETLICYRHGALRAAIVMAWNLAYDHLARWILADAQRLAAFNAGIAKRNPKKTHLRIASRADFEELKEDETVDIAGAVAGISGGIKKLLKEKLGRRNTYAHPSTMKVERAQVDDMITDLVNNVVLVLELPS